MTELWDTIQREVSGGLYQPWDTRAGTVVPSTETVALNGGRVDLRAAMLYADLADSSVIAVANREAATRLFPKSSIRNAFGFTVHMPSQPYNAVVDLDAEGVELTAAVD